MSLPENDLTRKRGRPRTEGVGGSASTTKRRLLEEALRFTFDCADLESVDDNVGSMGGGEPDVDPFETRQTDFPEIPSDDCSTFRVGSELASVSDVGSVCGVHSETDCVGEATSEGDSMAVPGSISSPFNKFDEPSELSVLTSDIIEGCGALTIGILFYDCDTCLECRCIVCDVCSHDDGCVHCEKCLSDDFSDCSDSDTFLSCFEDLEDFPDEFEEVLSEEDARNASIKRDLIDIAVKNHLTHAALRDILLFCRKYQFGNLPKCASTLLKTSRNIDTREVEPGEYWHHGLAKSIMVYLDKTNCHDITVDFSVDGVPVAKSANTSFWVIAASFNDSQEVYLVGCYCGPSKPDNSNEFLREFVDELKVLCVEGLTHRGRNVNIICGRGIFDAPAKSFVCNTKGCNASCGCPGCTVEGEMMDRRMTYLQTDAPLRSDEGFLRKDQEEYHKGDTILAEIPFFMPVSQIPFDYLHLILLGVMRKLLYMWIQGPLTVRLSGSLVNSISEELIKLNTWVPRDFVRGTRSLQFVKRFKASEFLLYVLPVVLRKNFPRKLYEHFLALHIAVTIMIDPVLCTEYVDSAKDLCLIFVEKFKKLYGYQYISHNVHAFIHIADDVKRHGPLDKFSSFKYENFYQYLLRIIHKGRKPLQQLASRYSEFERINSIGTPSVISNLEFSRLHCDGPLISDCQGPQYKCCKLRDDCEVILSQADNCVMIDTGEIVVVRNFAHSSVGDKVVIGQEFLNVNDLYSLPCASSVLDIVAVTSLSELKVWPASSLARKCFRMPLGDDGFAVFPLRHSGKQ